jgi:hypothetical protein
MPHGGTDSFWVTAADLAFIPDAYSDQLWFRRDQGFNPMATEPSRRDISAGSLGFSKKICRISCARVAARPMFSSTLAS